MKLGRDELRVGVWFAPCCIEDLVQIEDEEDLEWARWWFDDSRLARAWDTKESALEELKAEAK